MSSRQSKHFKKAEILHNLMLVVRAQADFEVPDIVEFQDYWNLQDQFARNLCLQAKNRKTGPFEIFPYPKSNSKGLREFTVALPEDLVLLSGAGGRIANTTNQLLSTAVISCKLRKKAPFWELCGAKGEWRRFEHRALTTLEQRRVEAMFRIDVEKYFPSIDLRILMELLATWGCDPIACGMVQSIISDWNAIGLAGLPIGPDASRILGNAMLIPADQSLADQNCEHLRFMDDMLLFGPNSQACEILLRLVETEVRTLGLRLSKEKELRFDNSRDAIRHLRDDMIASLGSTLRFANEKRSRQAIRHAFDEEIRDRTRINSKRYRYILGCLAKRRDAYAAAFLAENPSIMEIDPLLSGRYLAEASLTQKKDRSKVVDGACRYLCDHLSGQGDALALHLLKALSSVKLGHAEGRVFETLGCDSGRRPSLRSWAWKAHSQTSAYSERKCIDRCAAEKDIMLQRALLICGRCGSQSTSRQRSRLLGHIAETRPELEITTAWAGGE